MIRGKILIVDDSRTEQLKLKKAIEALGHTAVTVGSGQAALDALRESAFDLVLLDIVMPELDGFEVLKLFKASRTTHDLPVIVISALDEEMSSVVKAIELGAEDFLPKTFELALLNARVSTCIEKKRLRDVEREYLQRVAKLTQAAAALQFASFNPSKLGLQDVSSRSDGLGQLARVFSAMAQNVYERERKLRQNIRTFRGGLLLLACGALWGLNVSLSKMAANIAAHPIGLALMVNMLGAVICITIASARGKMPRLNTLNRTDWRFIVIWAFLSSIVNQVLIYWMASKLPAFTVTLLILLEGFIVFLFAAIMRIEAPNLKRLAGMIAGLTGVLIVVLVGETSSTDGDWIWLVVALLIPATYAAEDLYISERRPSHFDTTALWGITLVVSCLMLLPFAVAFNDFVPIQYLKADMLVLVVLMAVAAALAMILFVYLVATTGAVFASQNAYAVAAAGIGWSMILLGEQMPLLTWGALALIVVGLILVEPKHEAEEEPPLMDAMVADPLVQPF